MISRKEWGARETSLTTDGPKQDLVIHHSVSAPPATYNTRLKRAAHMRALQNMHINSNGWADIGYNFVMFPATGNLPAEIYEGRGFDAIPAAQLNHNTGTIALCVVGNFDRDRLGKRGRGRIVHFAKRCKRHKGITRLRAHRDYMATGCPGEHLYKLLPRLRDRAGLK